jgi:hypothetical protein
MYAIMLTGGTITTSLLKSSIEDYDFQHMILMMVYFHVFVLIIGIAIFNKTDSSLKTSVSVRYYQLVFALGMSSGWWLCYHLWKKADVV